jgi:type I restriction enzyme S subunit
MVPEGWDTAPISEAIQLHLNSISTDKLAGFASVRLYSLPAFDVDKEPKKTHGSSIKSGKNKVPPDCVLLSKLNPRIPRIWRVRHDSIQPAVCSTEFWPITSRGGKVDLDYLTQYFYSPLFLDNPLIRPASSTNSHQRIDRSAFLRFLLPLPPLPEQKKIAAILGSVDKAIQATQAVIDQTRKVKQGLLQQLLTRGIGHTHFKQTEIGEIPEEWKVCKIGELSDFVTSGSRGWAQYYAESGSLFVRITNLFRGTTDIDLSDVKYVALPPDSTEGKRTQLLPGDVLVSITADLGLIGVVPDVGLGEAYINQHIALVRPKKTKVQAAFLGYALISDAVQNCLWRSNDSGSKAGLNLPSVRKIQIALPPLEEQREISIRLSAVGLTISENKKMLGNLKSLKKGLMQDLLTGRVRVGGAEFAQKAI